MDKVVRGLRLVMVPIVPIAYTVGHCCTMLVTQCSALYLAMLAVCNNKASPQSGLLIGGFFHRLTTAAKQLLSVNRYPD